MTHTSKTTTRSKAASSEKTAKAVITTRKSRTTTKTEKIDPQQRMGMIAEAAYLRAEQRGFGPGDALEDWLSAEREVDLLLAENATTVTQ